MGIGQNWKGRGPGGSIFLTGFEPGFGGSFAGGRGMSGVSSRYPEFNAF